MKMKIAVLGGDGTIGRKIVSEAQKRGHEVHSLSLSTGVDVMNLELLTESLKNIDTVIDVLSILTADKETATKFFTNSSNNIILAEKANSVKHHITLSIVNALTNAEEGGHYKGYYAGKKAQEEVISSNTIPWTIFRATQFNEFVPQNLNNGLPEEDLLNMMMQPDDTSEVASELIDLVENPVFGILPDFAGPDKMSFAEMNLIYLEATKQLNSEDEIYLRKIIDKKEFTDVLTPKTNYKAGKIKFTDWLKNETTNK